MNPKGSAAKTVASASAGAVVGAGVYSIVGGVGSALGGTALSVTVGPFIAIGAGLGAAGYGVYWLGKQVGQSMGSTKGGDK